MSFHKTNFPKKRQHKTNFKAKNLPSRRKGLETGCLLANFIVPAGTFVRENYCSNLVLPKCYSKLFRTCKTLKLQARTSKRPPKIYRPLSFHYIYYTQLIEMDKFHFCFCLVEGRFLKKF